MYGSVLRATPIFGVDGTMMLEGKGGKIVKVVGGDKRWEELHKRVTEHVRFAFLNTNAVPTS